MLAMSRRETEVTRQGVRNLNLVGKPPPRRALSKVEVWHRCDMAIPIVAVQADGISEFVVGYRCSACGGRG